MNVEIVVPSILNSTLTYIWPFNVLPQVGQLVEVPLKNSTTTGIIWSLDQKVIDFKHQLKTVSSSYPLILPVNFICFLKKFADYTLTPLGVLTKHVLPKQIMCKETYSFKAYHFMVAELTSEQCFAKNALLDQIDTFNVSLLDGVTGSGKTEIYLEVAAEVYKSKKQVLILLPEISLTAQFCQRLTERFGDKPLVWHSQITPKQRNFIWHRVLSGEPCIILGARSALFLPFSRLGLLIIDEEHDASYKQEEVIIYNARDMAILRAKEENIQAILVSATPSLETIHNVAQKKYKHIQVTNRFYKASLPEVKILSMRALKKEERTSQWIHPSLFQEIQNRLLKKEQSLLFLNRRGYAPLTICSNCGFKIICTACDVALVQHKNQPRLHCHYCDYTQPIPEACPQCLQPDLTPCGPGVERLSEELVRLLPETKVLSVTSDLVNTPKRTQEMVDKIQNNEIDVVVATQMLSKGYHFSNITLVGVIDADMGLNGPDLRCAERTYQQLHQVAGRCGREHKPGVVYLQTYEPEHLVIKAVAHWDRESFIDFELDDREHHYMPPFGRLTSLLISGVNNLETTKFCRQLLKAAPIHGQVTVMGPVPAPFSKLKNQFRWRFLLKYPRDFSIQVFIKFWLEQVKKPYNIRLIIDIDPQSFH